MINSKICKLKAFLLNFQGKCAFNQHLTAITSNGLTATNLKICVSKFFLRTDTFCEKCYVMSNPQVKFMLEQQDSKPLNNWDIRPYDSPFPNANS